MQRRNVKDIQTLISILVLFALALYVVWPDSPGIHIDLFGNRIDRDFRTSQGLDLQGGLQVQLLARTPNGEPPPRENLEAAKVIVENRVNGLGVSEPLVQVQGNDRIIVELPGIRNPEEAIRAFGSTGLLEIIDSGASGLPLGSVVTTTLGGPASVGGTQPVTSTQQNGTPTGTVTTPLGTPTGTVTTPAGTPNRTVTTTTGTPVVSAITPTGTITTPTGTVTSAVTPTVGVTTTAPAAVATGTVTTPVGAGTPTVAATGTLTTPAVTGTPTVTATEPVTTTPPTPPTLPGVYTTIISGTQIADANVGVDPNTGQLLINFRLKDEAASIFGDWTTRNVGRYLSIVLDKRVIQTASIREPITQGSGQISGRFTLEEAQGVVIQLKYGALPVPLRVIENRSVGPTLGAESVNRSLLAGAIGLSLVIIFMLVYYRLPGLMASLALIIYAVISFAIFKLIPVTLTLPGIAGFILSIGMAVDANILIFERMKEELRSGKTMLAALEAGFRRAWTSIRDSNASTLLTCAILFWFGTTFGASIIRGFALTLAIGVIVSLFTAIIVSRTFMRLLVRSGVIQEDSQLLFGDNPSEIAMAPTATDR